MDKLPYVLPVLPHIIQEIQKRGALQKRKDTNGVVQKQNNRNNCSSLFGWGVVDDTIPIDCKNLENVRRNMSSIMHQIQPDYETPVDRFPTGKRAREEPVVVVAEPPAPAPPVKLPRLMDMWYEHCVHENNIGAIGMIPQCYQTSGIPEKEEIVHTNIGQVLMHFCKYIGSLWTRP